MLVAFAARVTKTLSDYVLTLVVQRFGIQVFTAGLLTGLRRDATLKSPSTGLARSCHEPSLLGGQRPRSASCRSARRRRNTVARMPASNNGYNAPDRDGGSADTRDPTGVVLGVAVARGSTARCGPSMPLESLMAASPS